MDQRRPVTIPNSRSRRVGCEAIPRNHKTPRVEMGRRAGLHVSDGGISKNVQIIPSSRSPAHLPARWSGFISPKFRANTTPLAPAFSRGHHRFFDALGQIDCAPQRGDVEIQPRVHRHVAAGNVVQRSLDLAGDEIR